MKTQFSLDHIDPLWEEGRDYQLICGFSTLENEIIVDYSYNSRKTNRFVPYRVKDYPAPLFFGDLCEFLIRGEWTICKFGGTEWWVQSNDNGCGPTKGGKRRSECGSHVQATLEGRRKAIQTQRELKIGIYGRSPAQKKEDGAKAGRIGGKIGGRMPFWIHSSGRLTRSFECPGDDWQKGRKWREE